jgi:hypothetical protein
VTRGIDIDRLALQVQGVSEEEGRRLAEHVALSLATGAGMPAAGDIPFLQVDVATDPREGLPELAERIVAEVLRQLGSAT